MYATSTLNMLFFNKTFDGDFFNPKKLHVLGFPKFQLLKPKTSNYFYVGIVCYSTNL